MLLLSTRVKPAWRPGQFNLVPPSRPLSNSARARAPTLLSSRFVPTQKADSASSSASPASSSEPTTASISLLLRGGYLRSTASGVYTLLPNALRVLQKLQTVVEAEMESIHASRLEMPTLLARRDWERSGRWSTMGSELFKLKDRRGSDFLLAPTHEEEVTRIVGDEVHSQRALPVRVYQMTRKHRDEPRPRMGLLRTKEFLMKDLYTFDASLDDAKLTYESVRGAYARIFDSVLGTGAWLAAEADTGAMGGSLSHEYHVEDPAGEDTLLSCSACGRSANVELASSQPRRTDLPSSASELQVHLYGPDDGGRLTAVVVPASRQASEVKVAKLLSPGAKQLPRPVGAGWDWKERPEGPLARFDSLSVVVDTECVGVEPDETYEAVQEALIGHYDASSSSSSLLPRSSATPRLADLFPSQLLKDSPMEETAAFSSLISLADVRVAEAGDACSCGQSQLVERRAIEIGHTFVLGSRYSDKLGVGFIPTGAGAKGKSSSSSSSAAGAALRSTGRLPFQMGCYGIGLTRLIGVLAHRAAQLYPVAPGAEEKGAAGLIWPPHLAPFCALVLPSSPLSQEKLDVARRIAEALGSAGEVNLSSLLEEGSGQAGSGASTLKFRPTSAGDVALDDRATMRTGEKLAEADLVGYPLVVVVGKDWEKGGGKVELRWWQRPEGDRAKRASRLVDVEQLLDNLAAPRASSSKGL